MNTDSVKAISLFSGLGGMDIGLHQAGVETVICIEKSPSAAKTLRINSHSYPTQPDYPTISVSKKYPWQVLQGDIRSISAQDVLNHADIPRDSIDLIVGGPPCQTFSRSNEGEREGIDSNRGKLFREFVRILQEIEPDAFIFENVRGLISSNDGKDLQTILTSLREIGFNTDYEVLNAADYGVPQTRERLFIVGLQGSKTPTFPEPTHKEAGDDPNEPWVSTGVALDTFDLDEIVEEQGGYRNALGGTYGHLLRDIPKGANYQHFTERRYDPCLDEYVPRTESELDDKHFEWRSRHWNYLLKLDPTRPSWTIQADPGSTVGPFHWRGRKLSLLEQMRLMDLPADYYIAGSPNEIQSQIGNAVPPSLMRHVTESILEDLGKNAKLQDNSRRYNHPTADNTHSEESQFRIKITSSESPWYHAHKIIQSLHNEGAVVVESRGRSIPYSLDALEIVKQQIRGEVEIDIVGRGEDSENDGRPISTITISVVTETISTEKVPSQSSNLRAI